MLESKATPRAILYDLPLVIIHVNMQNDMYCCGTKVVKMSSTSNNIMEMTQYRVQTEKKPVR